MELRDFKHIHFVGIGGAGMSAIARVLVEWGGLTVSGSDMAENALTRRLAEMGAIIHVGHRAGNIAGADLVVTSTAIRADNPERVAAQERGIPQWRRARVLAAIMHAGRSVAVSGTHGKTTITSMIGLALARAGMDPTVLIGGELQDFGSNARIGKGEWIVAEADESDASFHEMRPDRIIVSNIEADHLDYYADLAAVDASFRTFLGNLREGGKLIACFDDPGVRRLMAGFDGESITYGLCDEGADMLARAIVPREDGPGMQFEAVWRGQSLGTIALGVPGRHNVLNALAALACGMDLGAPLEPMREALAVFGGARRRFQRKGCVVGVTIVDDYAHHPTEIRATLEAARQEVRAGRVQRIVALFQPHRYSRTLALAEDFGAALQGADVVLVTDVYGAGEPMIEGVSGRLIHDAVVRGGHAEAHYCPTLDDAREEVLRRMRAGDLLLTAGAGNIYTVGERILNETVETEKS
jgi:UDP-N-acetylmuramate--alanine ligase